MDKIKFTAFITAAEKGSFTSAAEILGYTQPGITKLIGMLEEELGFRLFIRDKKGVTLTENGKLMLPAARSVINSISNAEQLSADIRGTVQGVLTIGSYYSISSMRLPGIIKEFGRRYPNVNVSLREGGNRDMHRWLFERSVDCCFCAEPSDVPCDWFPVFDDEIVAWLPKSHSMVLSGASEYPVERISEESFIHTQPDEDTEIDRMLSKLPVKPEVRFTTRDAFTTYNMVAAGLGMSFNQRLITEKWDKSIVEMPFSPPQYVSLGIAVPSKSESSPAARKFIECALEMMLNK